MLRKSALISRLVRFTLTTSRASSSVEFSMSQYLVELEKRQLVQQIASEQRQEAARVALKDDLKAAQAASETRQEAAQVALKDDLKAAQAASEQRQEAAQVASEQRQKAAQVTQKADMQEALKSLEINMKHSTINNIALVGLCVAAVGLVGTFGSWIGSR